MAAPGGGRLWSMAWKWFDEKKACEEVAELRGNIGKLPAVAEPIKEVYQALPKVSGSVLCFGCTGYIGEAVVFDAVRRGLNVTVFIRQKTVDRFTAVLKELKIQDRVTLHVGDLTVPADVEKAMNDAKAPCVISLLASPQVTDEQNIHDVDYDMSHTVVQAARKCGVKQMIYCSDTGVYQPALCTQFHKLRIEGELMRSTPDGLQWTIIRPTTYHPYVVSAIVLEEVRNGKGVSLFGSADDVGGLALYNPIAREDLGRFIVSCVSNQATYGRVLAVGGPWSADNVSTLKDTTDWMIQYGTPEGVTPSKITPLGMRLSTIIYDFMKLFGHLSPQLKKVATIVFYYTKYWSTVSHFSPGTGVYDTKSYVQDLVAAVNKDPEAFEQFVANAKKSTTASVVYPTPRNSWWDLSQASLSPDQIPMGAGKPHSNQSELTQASSSRVDPAHEAAVHQLRTLAASTPICIGNFPLPRTETDVDSDWFSDEDAEEHEPEWVNLK